MSIFKCKMCGGTIDFNPGDTVGVCDSCGTKQTLPRLDDDRRTNLYDRANHFRRNNEFDKAAGIYEQILTENNTDAEAYWSLVLCRYGIEYVEDPKTHKRVPTINRAQFTSIFDDEDYKSALNYADSYQRTLYEDEANTINEIQKGILAISQKEEPFDVFICYKETDNNGRRTHDSVLATDLYHQLTQEGLKVFFSRITLEDKLGTAYEPYIFAALNSAKVMVVLGTRPEYFNAVWVKNEWSRFLYLVKASKGEKILIPAYRDMDPYDLPEEFSHLQAQDMSKLGFMQDLIRGIKKIIKEDELKVMVQKTGGDSNVVNVAPLLKRAFLFLEDGEWSRADDFCEQVLNQDPENAKAYLGKLMVELRVRHQEDLANCEQPFNNSNNYQKALRFGDDKIAEMLSASIEHINERNDNIRLTNIYNNIVSSMNAANTEQAFIAVYEAFKTIHGFKDADYLAGQCLEKAEFCRKSAIYTFAKSQMVVNSVGGYEAAIKTFNTISGWQDVDEQIFVCKRRIAEIRAQEEAYRLERERHAERRRIYAEKISKKLRRVIAIVTPIIAICIVFVTLLTTVFIPDYRYRSAIGKYGHMLNEASIGDTIKFGQYEQDNNYSNGKEEIEWIVLAKADNKVLVISKYALDCQRYNSSLENVTWETCSLRKWLNGSFLKKSFGPEEQRLIQKTTITADKNPSYAFPPGNNTIDKVFLLNITDVNELFNSDISRQCQRTAYCYARGGFVDRNDNCWWWLRINGYDYKNAASVAPDGSVLDYGNLVDCKIGAVRPAMWICYE